MNNHEKIEQLVIAGKKNFVKGDHQVNVARLKYQEKRVTNPKRWADLTEGQRQQWREWYAQEQKLKNAKKQTTNKVEPDQFDDGDGQDNQ